jgi:D-alanine-D-alanine ligase
VFNLVETLDATGRLIHLFPALLEAMGLAFTGACADAIYLTSNKIRAKERMVAAGLPTPAWIGPFPQGPGPIDTPAKGFTRWIAKSLWEHASIGLDADGIVQAAAPEMMAILRQRAASLGGACFAEAFIAGREFNLSLIADDSGPQVLPPAEIVFTNFDPTRPRIVDYRAKWDVKSFAYQNTPRRFDFEKTDAPLLDALADIARRCWTLFGLGGYARVDFRVDAKGRPWVLEINANPCIAPDAGFAAALDRAGISFETAVDRIIADALKPV